MGRLINHSKTGNCQTKLHDINGVPHLILVASRDIDEGEELLYDYGDRSKASIAAHPWLKYWSTERRKKKKKRKRTVTLVFLVSSCTKCLRNRMSTLFFFLFQYGGSGRVTCSWEGRRGTYHVSRSICLVRWHLYFLFMCIWNILVVLQHISFVRFVFPIDQCFESMQVVVNALHFYTAFFLISS